MNGRSQFNRLLFDGQMDDATDRLQLPTAMRGEFQLQAHVQARDALDVVNRRYRRVPNPSRRAARAQRRSAHPLLSFCRVTHKAPQETI
jgi:hypothetical protein